MKDLYNGVAAGQSLAPAARTASANGTGVDLQGFEGAVVLIAAGAYTDGSHTFEIQESSDNAAFTAVADSDLQGTEPVIGAAAGGNQVYKIGYLGTKRYIRVAVTTSGTTTGAIYGASVVKGFARKNPA